MGVDGERWEQEFVIVRSLKAAKAEYRQAFEDLKMLKSEADYLNKQVDKTRAQLVLDFEAWYAAEYEGGGASLDESMMGGGADVSADGEVMDDGEKFDRLEVERVMAQVLVPASLCPPASSPSFCPLPPLVRTHGSLACTSDHYETARGC